MKQILITLTILLCATSQVSAQKYLDHLQQKKHGEGTVTVTQSKEINELVDGKTPEPVAYKPAAPITTTAADKTNKSAADNSPAANSLKEEAAKTREAAEKAAAERKERAREAAENKESSELDIPTIDTRKKVMKHSYKQTGYRVQVFAGGNSRADRIKAEQIQDKMKAAFPDQPIYTHFYSPRWICRMGNFTSYNEAQKILKKVRAMGYNQACIVKGKISVQY